MKFYIVAALTALAILGLVAWHYFDAQLGTLMG